MSALTEQSRLQLTAGVTFESLGAGQDTMVLSMRSGWLYSGNPTTDAVLRAMDGQRTLGQIADLLVRDFAAPSREQVVADMLALAEQLLREKLASVVA